MGGPRERPLRRGSERSGDPEVPGKTPGETSTAQAALGEEEVNRGGRSTGGAGDTDLCLTCN